MIAECPEQSHLLRLRIDLELLAPSTLVFCALQCPAAGGRGVDRHPQDSVGGMRVEKGRKTTMGSKGHTPSSPACLLPCPHTFPCGAPGLHMPPHGITRTLIVLLVEVEFLPLPRKRVSRDQHRRRTMFMGVEISPCFSNVPFPSIPPWNTSSLVMSRARIKATAHGFCPMSASRPGQHPECEVHMARQREGVHAGASGVLEDFN